MKVMQDGKICMEEIQLVRSRRKTVSLTVQPDGVVLVRAPEEMHTRQIKAFVEAHRDWIEKKQELVEKRRDMRKTFEKSYVSGEKFLFLGREYVLDLVAVPDKKRTSVERIADTLTVRIGTSKERSSRELREEVEANLHKWYRDEARKYIVERTTFFAERMGVTFGQIRLKEQKTRWGSCSSRGNLNFNWKLMMAPPEILDYVVVHELCHLLEMNHSKCFWEKVERILPDYRRRREWLKLHGEELSLKGNDEGNIEI